MFSRNFSIYLQLNILAIFIEFPRENRLDFPWLRARLRAMKAVRATADEHPSGDFSSLRIGTRGSDLALWQARRVAELIREHFGRRCELVVISTRGDRIRNVSFDKMEGKGFFTKELQDALYEKRVDLVVHSLKDLPAEEPEGLEVSAVVERGPVGEMLIARKGSLDSSRENPLGLPEGAVLGTSSLRRAAQALALRPDVKISALRGNVPTRVEKLRAGNYDAIILASAGVRRLCLDLGDLDVMEIPSSLMLPAAGQGALAVERRCDDPLTAEIVRLHDAGAGRVVSCERTLLELMGGGCHLPLGCLATVENDGKLRLDAVLGTVDEEMTCAAIRRVSAEAADGSRAACACRDQLVDNPPVLPGPT